MVKVVNSMHIYELFFFLLDAFDLPTNYGILCFWIQGLQLFPSTTL